MSESQAAGGLQPVRRALLGVRVPKSVPFFDCRVADEDLFRPGPDGRPRLVSDAAAVAVAGADAGAVVHRRGIDFYFDAREPGRADETRRIVADLRTQLARAWRDYRRALRNPAGSGEGGGVEYPPVAVTLGNFGCSVLADLRRPAVERLP